MSRWNDNEEIQILRKYLRISSVHPNINYEPCVQFLKEQAANLNLPVSVCYPVNDKNPVVIISWIGSDSDLPSIMLNSHMDVVPVFEEFWSHPPFSANIDESGRIFARGAQDMKSIGTQYLAAIRALRRDGIEQLKRTVHMIFVPDEEINGTYGMEGFVATKEFTDLNVGFALDEGEPSPTEDLILYYGERSSCEIEFVCYGKSGHGSLFLKNTPGKKVQFLINKFMELRDAEEVKLEKNANLGIGDVTTVNLTMMSGGVQNNVIPGELTIVFDIRLAVDVDHDEFYHMIERWCEEAGGNIKIIYQSKDPKSPVTATDDTNPFWIAFKNATDELNLKIVKQICSGGTDSRFLRPKNIPALGFSPIWNTPVRFHDHDEFVYADIYLEGIEIYKKIISKLASV
ncbi:Aminoacylase-1 [Pseudolycoriella hygida]|uniref:N-acyl-aliphatic-L-amino acid amidohydrolase n=1 Tax=Pseudolycoriella hygida TaxID=35572 RepID=A0A9Q0NEZ4_9DIPT|nr:Aminoacylase-1 [Pseudolycoriella hygida]